MGTQHFQLILFKLHSEDSVFSEAVTRPDFIRLWNPIARQVYNYISPRPENQLLS